MEKYEKEIFFQIVSIDKISKFSEGKRNATDLRQSQENVDF